MSVHSLVLPISPPEHAVSVGISPIAIKSVLGHPVCLVHVLIAGFLAHGPGLGVAQSAIRKRLQRLIELDHDVRDCVK